MRRLFTFISAIILLQGGSWLYGQVLPSDSLALVDFYNAAGGPNWTNQGGWLKGNVSTWVGIVVTNNRVTSLTLDGLNTTDGVNNFSGTVSPSIGNLSELTTLQLNGNETKAVYIDLHGALPAEIWNLNKLTKLQIKYTKISSWNPANLYKMKSLVEFNLMATKVGGSLPDSLFTLPKIQKLYLHYCNFSGAVPATIAKATSLTRFYVWGGNKLTSLPYVNITKKSLAKIELYGNYFNFKDVKAYADSSAKYLGYTNSYQLAKDTTKVSVYPGSKYVMHGVVTNGEGYAWFKDTSTTPLSTIDSLTVNNVAFSDTGIYVCKAQSSLVSGFDIRSIYNLKVKAFDLTSDSLALVDFYKAAGGPNWTNQGGWLKGNVSTWVGVAVTNNRVTSLTLDGLNTTDGVNNFSGTVSPSIGNLSELTTLQLNGNETKAVYIDLHGALPAEIWNLSKLAKLQIKYTKISSWDPTNLYKMKSLVEFNLMATKVGGSLPDSLFTLPKIQKLYLHYCNFSGAVPATIAKATNLTRFYVWGGNKLTSLPYVNITKKSLAKIELYGNYFNFKDVKAYADSSAKYLGYTNSYQFAKDTTIITAIEGTSNKLSLKVIDGESYAWFKGDATNAVATDSTYTIALLATTDAGTYVCKSQSSKIQGFDIRAAYVLKVTLALPIFISAKTENTGTKIDITFSKEMANAQLSASTFLVKVDNVTVTVNAVSLLTDKKIIELTLATAVKKGQVVTVTYANGSIVAADGSVLSSFTDKTVDNSSVLTSMKLNEISVHVMPNPVSDVLYISTANIINSIDIIEITGIKRIVKNNISGNNTSINVESLPNGIYFIVIETNTGKETHKIVKK